MAGVDTDAVLDLIQDVAARVITPRFRSLAAEDVSEKNPGDLVTVADREAEAELTSALGAAYPDAVVLGEETFSDDASVMQRFTAAQHSFTVDPVDGTKNFVHGSPDHAVMVAELRSGVVVRSWIWQPQHEAAYVAERGAGAWCNGERLRCADPGTDPATWRLRSSRRPWLNHSLPGTLPIALTWVCCGVDYPSLIGGLCDVLLYGNALPWDHAPGSLLLTEAGGALGIADGSSYDPTRPHRQKTRGALVVACSPELQERVAASLHAGELR